MATLFRVCAFAGLCCVTMILASAIGKVVIAVAGCIATIAGTLLIGAATLATVAFAGLAAWIAYMLVA